jgi:hypothetical protein
MKTLAALLLTILLAGCTYVHEHHHPAPAQPLTEPAPAVPVQPIAQPQPLGPGKTIYERNTEEVLQQKTVVE